MPRPSCKKDLLEASQTNFDHLWSYIDSMSKLALETPFDFSDDPKKTQAHWQRDKNLRDVLVHLYEWHQLLLNWIQANQNGEKKSLIPAPYTWKTYGEMNVEFWGKHQSTSLKKAKQLVQESHLEVSNCLAKFSDKELFTKKHFNWTGSTSLGSYCISATSSHYDWALKKLKAHQKSLTKHY